MCVVLHQYNHPTTWNVAMASSTAANDQHSCDCHEPPPPDACAAGSSAFCPLSSVSQHCVDTHPRQAHPTPSQAPE